MRRHITLLLIWTTVTAATLVAKAKRDPDLDRYVKFVCESAPKGCSDNVRGCYVKVTLEAETCRRKYPRSNTRKDPCSVALEDILPLDKLDRVMYCASYFVEHTPHNPRD